MPETLNLNYYYGNEADQYSFYRIPKILLTDRRYKGVSLEAKVLYGLLLDRMGLSARNGWLDDNGRVFLYFTQEEAMAKLYFDWGIQFDKQYAVPENGNRKVAYAEKNELLQAIILTG